MLALLLSLLAPAPAVPTPAPERITVAGVHEGRPYVVRTTQDTVTVHLEGQPQQTITVTRRVRLFLDAPGVRVLDRRGQRLSPAEVRRVLTEGTPLLLSVDGREVGAEHRERNAGVGYTVIVEGK